MYIEGVLEQRAQLLNNIGGDPRYEYIDILRIFSTFAVVVVHVSALKWYSVDIMSKEWDILNWFDSMVRWAVPVFVMISGALFLDRRSSVEKLYKKNILHIITCFLFWSVAYTAYYRCVLQRNMSIADIAVEIFKGPYHMWFCFMIVGLYIITPLLWEMVRSVNMVKYFLVVSFVFTFLLPRCGYWMSFISDTISVVINNALQQMDMHFIYGYTFYYLCGYYLKNVTWNNRRRWVIYVLGIGGFSATIFFTKWASVHKGTAVEMFYNYFAINVMLEAVCVFVFFKHHFQCKNIALKVHMRKIADYCFGAYLIHIMILSEVDRFLGENILAFNPILSISLISILVFVVSIIISAVLHQIPLLYRYIV